MIYSVFTSPQNISDLSENFGEHISNYISMKKLNDNIFTDIYQLRNKITPFALMYLLIVYSVSMTITAKPVGKAYFFDTVSNIRLNEDDYFDRLKSKAISVNSDLGVYMERNRLLGMNVITMSIYDRLFLNYFNTPEVYEYYTLYTKNKQKNIQMINKLNYTYFIEQFVEQDIKNPYDTLIFVSQFEYDEDIINIIRETIKKNFSQYLSKYFYQNWVYSYKLENGDFNNVVYHTLGKLLEIGIMSEDEFFNLMTIDKDDALILLMNTKVYYSFKQDPNEYFMRSGDDQKSIPQLNTSVKIENILDTIKSMNFDNMRVPTQEMMKKLLNQTQDINVKRTDDEIQKEFDTLPKDDLVDTDSIEDNEAIEEKYITSRDAQSMHEYMKNEAKKRNIHLDSDFEIFMIFLVGLQLILSMMDPTQVLLDYMFERLLNQGVLGSHIDDYRDDNVNFVMSLSTYPSFLVAQLMYSNLVDELKSNDIPVTKENLLNKLETWTDDEKWKIEKTSFLAAKCALSFLRNTNNIRYSGNPNIRNKSKIEPITFEKAKMVVQDGGSGLLELRKI
jgi:hypothetical protein